MTFLRRVPLPLVGLLIGLVLAVGTVAGGLFIGANAATAVDRPPALAKPGATPPALRDLPPGVREWLRRHSVFGVVVERSGDTLVLRARGQRLTALLSDATIVRKERRRVQPSEIAVNDWVLILGGRQPNDVIQARAILIVARRPNAGAATLGAQLDADLAALLSARAEP